MASGAVGVDGGGRGGEWEVWGGLDFSLRGWPLGVWSYCNAYMGNTKLDLMLFCCCCGEGARVERWIWEEWEMSVINCIIWNSQIIIKNIMWRGKKQKTPWSQSAISSSMNNWPVPSLGFCLQDFFFLIHLRDKQLFVLIEWHLPPPLDSHMGKWEDHGWMLPWEKNHPVLGARGEVSGKQIHTRNQELMTPWGFSYILQGMLAVDLKWLAHWIPSAQLHACVWRWLSNYLMNSSDWALHPGTAYLLEGNAQKPTPLVNSKEHLELICFLYSVIFLEEFS